MIHCFKICKEQFAAIDCEDQRFIVIKEDQDIGIGDNLVLLEYDKGQKTYSNRWLVVEVLYISQINSHIILSIRRGYRGDDASENC